MRRSRPIPALRRPLRALRRLGRASGGAATVEFVLWMPFFLGLLMLLADVSILAYRYTEMWDVARAAARELSLGNLPRTQDAVQAYVSAQLDAGYVASLSGAHTTFFTVAIESSPAALSVFGVLEAAVDVMTARVGMSQESLAAG